MKAQLDRIPGIHHVTAVAGEPQRNIDFYSGILGLRLVKLTVNFDDPTTYHFYYGDNVGHPGTILTFFPWPGAPRGLLGTGQLTTTSFSIPEDSAGYWVERFKNYGVEFRGPIQRFDERVLLFSDPDGLQLELVANKNPKETDEWKEGRVPAEHAIRGFYGVTITEADQARTTSLLTDTMGFRQVAREDGRIRFEAGAGGPSSIIDVLHSPDALRGIVSVGTVHHVAWRTPNDEQQAEWREKLVDAGLNVTPVIDRKYFHSIYFREPGGVLFEIATDPPGFAVDEPADSLGLQLKLPPWLESSRHEIEQSLPPVRVPTLVKAG
jgi:catechol 2,3-dioxygenase-like lactoylglutathione lyase family enzyme